MSVELPENFSTSNNSPHLPSTALDSPSTPSNDASQAIADVPVVGANFQSSGLVLAEHHSAANDAPEVLSPSLNANPSDLATAGPSYILGTDPQYGRLVISCELCSKSFGLQKTHTIPTICLLHVEHKLDQDRPPEMRKNKGSCRQQQRCKQLHVLPAFVVTARHVTMRSPLCCFQHEHDCREIKELHCFVRPLTPDPSVTPDAAASNVSFHDSGLLIGIRPSETILGLRFVVVIDDVIELTPLQLLQTKYFSGKLRTDAEKLAKRGEAAASEVSRDGSSAATTLRVKVNSSNVCANHLIGNCKFSDGCRYLHGCRVVLGSALKPSKPTRTSDHSQSNSSERTLSTSRNTSNLSHKATAGSKNSGGSKTEASLVSSDSPLMQNSHQGTRRSQGDNGSHSAGTGAAVRPRSSGQKWRHCPHRAPFKEYISDAAAAPPRPPARRHHAGGSTVAPPPHAPSSQGKTTTQEPQ